MRIISLEPNHRYVSLFVVIVVTGCSDAQPSTEVLKGAISQNVSGMTIENIECQSFADKSQEAAGRSSCKGTMSLNQDQHVLLYRNDAERLLISAGIPKTGAGYFLSRHPAQVYTLAASKGSVAEFSSECGYHRAVDAWNIGCSSNLPTFQGRPAYDIRPNDVVEGTPSYDVWIEQIKSDFKRLDQDYQTLETQVRTFFAPGKTISLRLREAGQILYQAQISKGISWEGEPGVLGHQGDFSTIVKYRDLRERRVQTLCGYGKGNFDDLQISGFIYFSGKEEAPFTARVQVREQTGTSNDTFSGCGNFLQWNGSTWGGKLNRSLELVSQ